MSSDTRSEACDCLVIGAGAGGLAMAILLAQAGKDVIVAEQNPSPGGALNSFYCRGIRLDAGFHFSGAMQPGGIFNDILQRFQLQLPVKPIFLSREHANRFYFSKSQRKIDFPYGQELIKAKLRDEFPGEHTAIERYLDSVERICKATPTMNITSMDQPVPTIPENYISLQEYLDGLTDNILLKSVLSALIMCQGSSPSEISLADHARVCQGFYESIATIDGGGESLAKAMLDRARKLGVKFLCGEKVTAFEDIRDQHVNRVILQSGREIRPKQIVATIHPGNLAEILPRHALPPAFFHRICEFRNTPSFFTVFAELKTKTNPEYADSILSLYPEDNINKLAIPQNPSPGPVAIVHSEDKSTEKTTRIITAFEPVYWQQVAQWAHSSHKNRPAPYLEWKKMKTEELTNRIYEHLPQYRDRMEIVAVATPLSYHDYLHTPEGAAYGTKRLVSQFNLIGPLRMRNVFVAGQSAILPGVLGTIVASIIVGRMIIGDNEFSKFLLPPS